MFKSIIPLRSKYDEKSCKYVHCFYLVDSEFECEVCLETSFDSAPILDISTAAILTEYNKRNLSLTLNLYAFNAYLLKDRLKSWSFQELIDYQSKYIDRYYAIPGINIKKDIYPNLLKIYEKLSVFE